MRVDFMRGGRGRLAKLFPVEYELKEDIMVTERLYDEKWKWGDPTTTDEHLPNLFQSEEAKEFIKNYIKEDIMETKRLLYGNKEAELLSKYNEMYKSGSLFGMNFRIKKVIFNGPATIVLWADGTKTVVKCEEGEIPDSEKGLAMAIAKKALGNKGNYYNEFKKWLPKENKPEGASNVQIGITAWTRFGEFLRR